MEGLSGKVIFSVGTVEFKWEDVLAAARKSDGWPILQRTVRRGLACLKKAERDEDVLVEEIIAAAKQFRYSKDLISAEEMEAWLKQRGVTPEQWMAYIERRLLLQRYVDQLEEIATDFSVDEAEVESLLEIEGLCSGFFRNISVILAGRAAIFFSRKPEEARSSTIQFEKMDQCFEDFRKKVITHEVLERNIQSHVLDWIRFNIEGVAFPEENMIREAVLCIKEDGSSLFEIASQTNASHWTRILYLEDLPRGLRDSFAGSKPADLLGPFPTSEGFEIYYITEKKIPSILDDEIRARAEEDALAQMVDREINDRVMWDFAI